MYRHQIHLLLVCILIALKVGKQRNLLKEVRQINIARQVGILLPTLHEILHTIEEFLEVLLSCHAFRLFVSVQVGRYSTLLYYVIAQRVGIFHGDTLHESHHQRAECLQTVERFLSQAQSAPCGR